MPTRRKKHIREFLEQSGWGNAARQPIKGDASFRRYERLIRENEDNVVEMAILMDAPPPKEDVRPFIFVTEYLHSLGLSAPKIYAADEKAGLLLLEDLKIDSFTLIFSGSLLLSNTLAVEDKLYRQAVDVLTLLHHSPLPEGLPEYNNDVLLREVMLFMDWYIPHKDIPLTPEQKQEFIGIWESLFPLLHRDKKVFVHRDYHADNLIWITGREKNKRVGLLDYQDALAGSSAYDLVSLMEDARRDVSEVTRYNMVEYFLESNPDIDPEKFRENYAILGAQRNLKIVGIFTRLAARDGKPKYLEFLPRVWNYIEKDIQHPTLAPLANWLNTYVPNRKTPPKTPFPKILAKQ